MNANVCRTGYCLHGIYTVRRCVEIVLCQLVVPCSSSLGLLGRVCRRRRMAQMFRPPRMLHPLLGSFGTWSATWWWTSQEVIKNGTVAIKWSAGRLVGPVERGWGSLMAVVGG